MVVNDEPAFVAWFLGGLRSGVVPVPLSTMLTGDELAAIVADAGATAVVASAEHADRIAPIVGRAPSVRAAIVVGEIAIGHRYGHVRVVGVLRHERSTGGPDRSGLRGVLAVQLGNHWRAEGGHAPPQQHAGHRRHLRS